MKNLEFLTIFYMGKKVVFPNDLLEGNVHLKKVDFSRIDISKTEFLQKKHPDLFNNKETFTSILAPVQTRNGQKFFTGYYKFMVDYYCDGTRRDTNVLRVHDNGQLEMYGNGFWRIGDDGKFSGVWQGEPMLGSISPDGKSFEGSYARGCFEAVLNEK